MKNIIVATDLSTNSRSGVRHAIQMASTGGVELHFVYVHHVLRASFWTDKEYEIFINEAEEVRLKELSRFIKAVYHSMSIKAPLELSATAVHHSDTVEGLVEIARKKRASLIVTSTKGAGAVRRWLGTTTTKLFRLSPIPVLCIPSHANLRSMDRILYASDMNDYESELKKVVGFAKPIGASIEVLHLYYPYDNIENEEMFKDKLESSAGYPLALHYRPRDLEKSIIDEIRFAVNKTKPSLLVLFTNQGRSFFERILLPGNAKEFAFQAKIPVLSFPKPDQ